MDLEIYDSSLCINLLLWLHTENYFSRRPRYWAISVNGASVHLSGNSILAHGQYAKREEQRRPKWRKQQCHLTFAKSFYHCGINVIFIHLCFCFNAMWKNVNAMWKNVSALWKMLVVCGKMLVLYGKMLVLCGKKLSVSLC